MTDDHLLHETTQHSLFFCVVIAAECSFRESCRLNSCRWSCTFSGLRLFSSKRKSKASDWTVFVLVIDAARKS